MTAARARCGGRLRGRLTGRRRAPLRADERRRGAQPRAGGHRAVQRAGPSLVAIVFAPLGLEYGITYFVGAGQWAPGAAFRDAQLVVAATTPFAVVIWWSAARR